ncbi:hypothetical protein HDV05_008390, partial [Chytridiales sp. JEL 0842]
PPLPSSTRPTKLPSAPKALDIAYDHIPLGLTYPQSTAHSHPTAPFSTSVTGAAGTDTKKLRSESIKFLFQSVSARKSVVASVVDGLNEPLVLNASSDQKDSSSIDAVGGRAVDIPILQRTSTPKEFLVGAQSELTTGRQCTQDGEAEEGIQFIEKVNWNFT